MRRRRELSTALLFLLFVGLSFGQEVRFFAFGHVGFSGLISQGEKDYQTVLTRPTAAPDFEYLLRTGNPQAKAYALVGLHSLNPGQFKRLLSGTTLKDQPVEIQSGCIVSREQLLSIEKNLAAGEYSVYEQKNASLANSAAEP